MRKFREMIFSGGNKGFTLIELLVVIAVLGILAGIAVPRMMGISDQATKASVESNFRTIRNGLEMYYVDNNNSYTNASFTALSEFIDITELEDSFAINIPTTGGYSVTYTVTNSSIFANTPTMTQGGVTNLELK
jgi:prepilin-type N-terminal cleavage/methylation domain-containing protein